MAVGSDLSCVIEMLNRRIETLWRMWAERLEWSSCALMRACPLPTCRCNANPCGFGQGLDDSSVCGGCLNSALTFCFHIVRETKPRHGHTLSNTPCSAMQDLGCRIRCLTACSVRICRSWIHCTIIERPCQHAYASDSLSRLCRRFRPIVVFSCCLELARWVCQYGPAHPTCI